MLNPKKNKEGNIMKTRLTLLFIATLIVTSCTAVPTIHKTSCDPGPKGNPKEIPIPIVYTSSEITKPKKTTMNCVRPGDVIRFMLNGRPGVEVSVDSDDTAAPWLKGRGKILPRNSEGWFWVSIPLEATDGDFKYTIKATGLPDLDPIVRVRHSY